MDLRNEETTATCMKEHDATLRLLVEKNVPMIVEGSSFPNGNVISEIQVIKKIIQNEKVN